MLPFIARLPLVLRAGLAGAFVLTAAACEPPPGDAQPADTEAMYPPANRTDHTDSYFGEEVADPYRWMEDVEAPAVQVWVEAQNAMSVPYLKSISARAEIAARLEELWDYERVGVPEVEGGTLFYSRNNGLQDQDVLMVQDSSDGEPVVLIDPNTFSEDGTVSLAGYSVSPDGVRVAYGQSDGGTDWKTWRVRDVESGIDLDEVIGFTKFTGISWTPDGRGFYYSRYPETPEGDGDGQSAVTIYYHALGTPQSADEPVYSLPDHPRRNPYGQVTEDGRYLIIRVSDGYEANGLYYKDLEGEGDVIRLLDRWDALYTFVGNEGSTFYLHTNKDAPRWRVVALDVNRPDQLRDIVPETGEAMVSVSWVGGRLFTEYLSDASSSVRVYDAGGGFEQDVDLPALGSASGFGGDAEDTETYYGVTSFTDPGAVFRFDIATGESSLWKRSTVAFDPDEYVTQQVFVESADGTRVPIFLVHRSDLDVSQPQPTVLYGYGGFNISLTPSFSLARLVWMERGGILAVANLRGGGEYGADWHAAGTRTNKQNVFDDFITAAEWLIETGMASPQTLAIQGGSNGGLLVGAVMTQRPDLFGAALPAVGVMDMLRYHTASSNARAWSSDYGLSENEEEFRALSAYSPLHNLEEGVCYPPTLITTADRDDRVVPWHSFKFGAAAQAAQGCDNPILVRVETRAGHGAGKPTWMRIEEIADSWAFLEHHLRAEDLATDR